MAFFRSFVLFLAVTGCGGAASEATPGTLTAADAPFRDDPEGASIERVGAPLNRTTFIRAVLRRNPGIEAARHALRAALARTRQAGAFEDPMVDLGIAPLSVASSSAHFGYEARVSQRLPWFGKRGLEQAASAAEANAAKGDYEAMKRELALTALTLYDQYTVVSRSLDINAHHVELMRTLRTNATAQLESGRGSAQDPLMAEVGLARMERESVGLSTERALVIAEMNELLHRLPEARLAPPPADVVLLPPPDVLDSARLGQVAVSQRPDVSSLRERAKAERAREDRAAREYLPDFTVSTSYNSMWQMPEHRWMVGLGFNLPIFAGKRATAGEEARAMRAAFESEASRAESAARKEIHAALTSLSESKQVLALYETRLLPLAKDQIDAARAGFITSRNPFSSVVEAERSLRDLELEYLKTKAAWNRQRGELARALGLIPGLDTEEERK